jgi:hypothetical protein
MLYVYWLSLPLALYEMWLNAVAAPAPCKAVQPPKIREPR